MMKQSHEKGIALFISIIAVSALLLIAFSIADIAYKQQVISASSRESEEAFYAADTGLECALYHDLKLTGAGDTSFFPTSAPGGVTLNNLHCDGQTFSAAASTPGSSPTTTSSFNLDLAGTNCFKVDVDKGPDGFGGVLTYITSRGYNTTCANTSVQSLRTVERALQVHY